MKTIISLFILIIPILGHSQTVTQTERGYEIEDPHVFISVDTIRNICQAKIYARGKYYCNVKQGSYNAFEMDLRMYYGAAVTFRYIQCQELIIWNKKYTYTYKI